MTTPAVQVPPFTVEEIAELGCRVIHTWARTLDSGHSGAPLGQLVEAIGFVARRQAGESDDGLVRGMLRFRNAPAVPALTAAELTTLADRARHQAAQELAGSAAAAEWAALARAAEAVAAQIGDAP